MIISCGFSSGLVRFMKSIRIRHTKCIMILLSICMIAGCMTGCSGTKNADNKDENALIDIDPAASSMVLAVDEVIDGKHPVQIPRYESTIDSQVIEGINSDIDKLLMPVYERYLEADAERSKEVDSENDTENNSENNSEDAVIPDIRTILDESDKYLQAVVMYVEYPLLGSDGDVVSYNYVRAEDRVLTLSDALIRAETTLDDLKNEIIEVYYILNQDTEEMLSIYGITVDGFIINEDSSIDFYGNIDISVNAEEPWSYIYRYNNGSGEMELIEK